MKEANPKGQYKSITLPFGSKLKLKMDRKKDYILRKSGEHQIGKTSPKEKTKLIIFVIGGLTYPEIREVKKMELSGGLNVTVILGGTELITPKDYIKGLSSMASYYDRQF